MHVLYEQKLNLKFDRQQQQPVCSQLATSISGYTGFHDHVLGSSKLTRYGQKNPFVSRKTSKKKQTKQTQKPKRIADNRALNITQPVFEHMQMQRRSCSLHIHILIEYAPRGPCTHFWKSVGV
jgi:hypothetical protein